MHPPKNMPIRFLRVKDCPAYLGIDRNRFSKEVRPFLIPIPIGKRGIAFDILDLDAWANHYKRCSGRPAKRNELWDEKQSQVWSSAAKSGISTKKLTDEGFAKALAQEILKKQKSS